MITTMLIRVIERITGDRRLGNLVKMKISIGKILISKLSFKLERPELWLAVFFHLVLRHNHILNLCSQLKLQLHK